MASAATYEEYAAMMNRILAAGFTRPGESVFAAQLADYLPAGDDKIWPVKPSQMGPADIPKYLEAYYGPKVAGFARSWPWLGVH